MLNLDYTKHTQGIAFADDVLIMTKGRSILEAKNFVSQELSKISEWARNNNMKFNEQKSKTMLLTKRERIDKPKINIFLNMH